MYLVVLHEAFLAEVMLALGHDRIDKRLATHEALEWQAVVVVSLVRRVHALDHIFVWIVVVVVVVIIVTGALFLSSLLLPLLAKHCRVAGRLAASAVLDLPVALQLPAVLVVGPVVHELARVAEAAIARFLVVLAYVGLVVPAHSCPQVL